MKKFKLVYEIIVSDEDKAKRWLTKRYQETYIDNPSNDISSLFDGVIIDLGGSVVSGMWSSDQSCEEMN